MVDELVRSLLVVEPPIGLLFAVASAESEMSDETIKLIETSGRAIISSWVPQKMVLSHPATAFFLVSRNLTICHPAEKAECKVIRLIAAVEVCIKPSWRESRLSWLRRMEINR